MNARAAKLERRTGKLRAVARFSLGMLTGFVLLPVAMVAIWAAFWLFFTLLPPRDGPGPISGAAASRAGASSIVVHGHGAEVRQTCRGRCDDLEVGSARRIEMFDAHGKRIRSEGSWLYRLFGRTA